MKKMILCLLVKILTTSFVQAQGFISEIKTIALSDEEKATVRICLPEQGDINTIVVVAHGTGPNTYLTKRDGFNYYDVLAEGFCEQGVGFLTYNRRGVDLGESSPWFVKVDSVKYTQYLPQIEAVDIETMIAALKEDKRFKNCKIILYGISEGTIIASIVAERENVKIDALFLHGYAHENMFEIIKWQNQGHGIMIAVNSIFDKDNDKCVNKEEYEYSDELLAQQRGYFFQNMPFDSLDVVKDGFINIKDIEKMRAPFHDYLIKCVMENDYQWIRNNYFNLTPQWFKSHFKLESNKTRLLRVNAPIHIFHGTDDANVPVESVYELQSRFKTCNKTNLTIHVFEKHNHDLNFLSRLTDKKWSEGFQQLFKCAGAL